jgi:peptidoglycan/xylan/chitin deacetylase (PgdA/CDA1 family)
VSRARIESELALSVSHFAYPYGIVNADALARVGASYRTAVTTRLSFVRPEDSVLQLPRIDSYYLKTSGVWTRPLFGRRARAYLGLRGLARRVRGSLARA